MVWFCLSFLACYLLSWKSSYVSLSHPEHLEQKLSSSVHLRAGRWSCISPGGFLLGAPSSVYLHFKWAWFSMSLTLLLELVNVRQFKALVTYVIKGISTPGWFQDLLQSVHFQANLLWLKCFLMRWDEPLLYFKKTEQHARENPSRKNEKPSLALLFSSFPVIT